MKHARRTTLLLTALGLVAFTGCGYRFGHLADPEIRTVAVPMFESVADRTGLEIQLTEAVQKEIQSRTPFRLVHEGQADTVLRGQLVGVRKRLLSQSVTDDAREIEFALAVNVTWEDRRGNTLNEGALQIAPDAVPVLSTGTAAIEVGQSRATANQEAVQRIARQVVDLMEVPW
ncbi:LPS assembly lipoprotein LptE [Alienimonas chondri]|uniref:LPS-assembly lipoprotein LptE n=1 Tax=Alienimonas chondri TaxID=2681879 RepID=A0ABX1VHH5_9PLAN|nr:LPS assembly lipoprotein LptE [Alienimonas chondri]NNJ27536.1 hypothetical protein [Alienimonas chondri]